MEKHIIALMLLAIGLSSLALADTSGHNVAPKLSQVETTDGNIIQGEIVSSPNGNIALHFESSSYVFTIFNNAYNDSPVTGWVGIWIPKDGDGIPHSITNLDNIVYPALSGILFPKDNESGIVTIDMPLARDLNGERDPLTVQFDANQLVPKEAENKAIKSRLDILPTAKLPASTEEGVTRFLLHIGESKFGREYVAFLEAGDPAHGGFKQHIFVLEEDGTATNVKTGENVILYGTPDGEVVFGEYVFANARESEQSANTRGLEVTAEDTETGLIDANDKTPTKFSVPFTLAKPTEGNHGTLKVSLLNKGEVVDYLTLDIENDPNINHTGTIGNTDQYELVYTVPADTPKGSLALSVYEKQNGIYSSNAETIAQLEKADILDTRNIELYGQASDIPNTLLSLLKGHDATKIVIIDENGVKHTVENHRITTDTLDFRSIYPAGIDMRSTGSASKDTYFDLVIDGTIRRINVGLNPSQVITNPGGGTTGGGTVGGGGGF